MKNKTIHITTLGCDKNTVDSESMLGLIEEKKFIIKDAPQNAEIIIVNTCCFIQEAKEQSIDYILNYANYKKTGKCKLLIVAGCMAERYHEELRQEIKEIDGFLGVGHFENIMDLIENFTKNDKIDDSIYMGNINKSCDSQIKRYIKEDTYSTFVRISEGCNHGCTYCIIPKIRGAYRSRKSADIFDELADLQKKGIKEIIVIGQDIAPYGSDLKEAIDLPDLLEKIASTFNFHWIRMMYLYPEGVTPKLLQVIKNNPKICRYFDIPLQHTQNEILKHMGRKMTYEKIEEMILKIRKVLPDAVLRTSIITGFPGETKENHLALLDAIKILKFDHLGAFKYSQEEDTPAAEFPHQIMEGTKEKRYNEIMMTQQTISLEKNQSHVGRILEVLIEGKEDNEYSGRCYGDAPEIDGAVYIDSKGAVLQIGTFYFVKIVHALEYDLIGDIENEFTQ